MARPRLVTREVSTPPIGWYPDPWDTRQLRYWDGLRWAPYTAPFPYAAQYVEPVPALDAAIARMRAQDPRRWGWRPIAVPIVAMVAIIVAGQFAVDLEPSGGAGELVFAVLANLVAEGAVGVALYAAGRQVATRHGGWGQAFGWWRPKLKDLPVAGVGFLVAMALRLGVGVVLGVLTQGRANKQGENLQVTSVDLPTVLLLIAVVVIAAPLTEELMFRGLLLRTFMQRWSFWPAAIISTVIFGLFHTYEVGTLLGAVTLALTVGTLGIVNCVLVRRTGSLVPGMLVHAASNGLAVLVLVLTARSSGFVVPLW